jgi:hypothetical protein
MRWFTVPMRVMNAHVPLGGPCITHLGERSWIPPKPIFRGCKVLVIQLRENVEQGGMMEVELLGMEDHLVWHVFVETFIPNVLSKGGARVM